MRHRLIVLLSLAACSAPATHVSLGADAVDATPDSSTPGDAAPADAPGTSLRIGAAGSPAPLAAWDFGVQTIGSASPALALTVQNDTDQVSAALVVTTDPAFPLDASSSCAANIQLAPGATCSILVRFKPTASGSAGAALTVDGGPQVGAASLALAGVGVTGPDLDTTPPFVDFGTIEFGTSATRTLVMTNAGDDLVIQQITVDNPIGSGMTLASTTCSGALAHGVSCDLTVKFTPTDFGQDSGALTVTTDRGPYAIGANWLMGRGGARLVVQATGDGTVTSDGGGTPNVDCGTTCVGLFNNGPDHVLTASTGGTFLGWGGAGAGCGSADTCAVKLSTSGPTTVQATFSP